VWEMERGSRWFARGGRIADPETESKKRGSVEVGTLVGENTKQRIWMSDSRIVYLNQ
jgi:hypothetical protein